MTETIKKIQEGDKILLEEFIKNNIELVYAHTSKYYDILNDYDDLVQEVTYGFIKSIYNYKFNKPFERHANRVMYLYKERFLLKNIYSINDNFEQYIIALRFYDKCKKSIAHTPTVKEFARYHYIKNNLAYEIYSILNSFNNEYSLNDNICDNIIFEDESIKKMDSEIFKNNFVNKVLTSKQSAIISLKYGFLNNICYSETEIAKKKNMTRQNVNNLHSYAMKRLRKINKEDINDFLN